MGTRMSKENEPDNVYHLMSDKNKQSKSHQQHNAKHTETSNNTFNQNKSTSNHKTNKHKNHHKNDNSTYKSHGNGINEYNDYRKSNNNTSRNGRQESRERQIKMDREQAIDTLQSMFMSIERDVLQLMLMEQCQGNLDNAVEILLTMQAAATTNQGNEEITIQSASSTINTSLPSKASIKSNQVILYDDDDDDDDDSDSIHDQQQQSQLLFEPHMSLKDAFKLDINDKIDYQDLNKEKDEGEFGRFFPAIILGKKGTNLKIHYIGYSKEYDVWSDFEKEIHRFAESGSISKCPSYRFFQLKTGDVIDINPIQRHEGWKYGEIKKLDDTSGQIQVEYEYEEKKYSYWSHLDNTLEIGEFIIKSKLICKISGYVVKWKRIILVESFIDNITRLHFMTYIIPLELNKLIWIYFGRETPETLQEKQVNIEMIISVMQNFDFMVEIKHLSLYKILNNEHELKFNQNELRQILNHWITKKKMDGFRNEIIKSIQHCIGSRDNVEILKKLWRIDKMYSDEILAFINMAAKYGSFNCIAFLLNYVEKLDWTNERRPTCLYNAIRYQHNNLKLIHFIIHKLETLRILFICDEIMNEVIRYDIVDIAKRIIDNRWYELNQGDRLYAESINGKCHQFFNEKSNAFFFHTDNNEDHELNLDDNQWGNNKDGTDNDFGEDNDWENAEEFAN